MLNTTQCIEELADGFSACKCPRALCVEALRSLVRLAISEHIAAPALAIQADMDRVEQIRAASKTN